MVVGNHDISRDAAAYDITLVIPHDEDNLKSLFFFVVTTITCDSCRKRTRSGSEFYHFGTVENDNLLIFVGG